MKQKLNQSSKVFWPKTLVKKWLNIKGGAHEFQSDYSSKAFEGKIERRKSCSDRDSYVYVPPREFSGGMMETMDYVKSPKMETNASKDSLDLRMMVGTWNVGGKSPHKELDLRDWLTDSAQADIYVLGFQEIVPLHPGNILGVEDNGPAIKWLDLIRQALNNTNTNQNDPYLHHNYQNATMGNDPSNHKHHQGPQCSPYKPSLSFSDLPCLDGKLSNARLNSLKNPRSMSEKLNPVSISRCTSCLGQTGNLVTKRNKYCLVASKQMVGIFLCVWVRADLYTHVNYLRVSCVGTGIMGYLGNKGSISISMTMYNKTFCFVCTHLTSGEKEGNEIKRNSDVTEILNRTRFSGPYRPVLGVQPPPPDSILEHDKIIWFGDLNYRLASNWEDTLKLLVKHDWKSLLEKDQLRIEQKAGRVFKGWEEGRINFAPTYKFIPNSDCYAVHHFRSKEKRRAPAWCDRILWKGEGMKQAFYSKGESKFSDHRPVSTLFFVPVERPLEPMVKGIRLTTNLLSYNAKVQAEELLI